ncbi:uncharacterized protein LOC143287282 [Babylonia areolata]|uniref:uncharacterized protein LOC143287282 n=1 Tax=Babylonia areolata TaxID=304850 RepID=UPI003FD3830B
MVSAVLLLAAALMSSAVAQVPPPHAHSAGHHPPAAGGSAPSTGNGYPQVQSSHCRYLINAPSPWGVNASPFKLYTRSYAGEVKRGYPIEVSVQPLYAVFKKFKFGDFAIWAEPVYMGPHTHQREMEMQWGGGAAMPPPSHHSVSHVGVWKVFPQYSGGSGSIRCNMYSKGEDTVGTFEGRLLELLKAQMPNNPSLSAYQPTERNSVAFLWYPDEAALRSGSIKFVAKLKTFNQWFHLESTPWKVHIPPPPPRPMTLNFNANNMNTMVDRTVDVYQSLRKMERKLDHAGAGV